MSDRSTDGGWPHDPDGEEGSEGMRKFGLAVVAKKATEDEFPLDVETFLSEHGSDPVRINHRRVASVDDIFEYIDDDRFEDKVAFNRAVGEAMRRGDFWDYRPTA